MRFQNITYSVALPGGIANKLQSSKLQYESQAMAKFKAANLGHVSYILLSHPDQGSCSVMISEEP